MVKNSSKPTTWIVTEDHQGMLVQGKALAKHLGLDPEIKAFTIKKPWSFLPSWCWIKPLTLIDDECKTSFDEPWPDLIISVGRKGAILAREIKLASKNNTMIIQIQTPSLHTKDFDLIITPNHDKIKGDNVIKHFGSIHAIETRELNAAKKESEDLVHCLPKNKVMTVLLGGNSKHHTLTEENIIDLAKYLNYLYFNHGYGFLISVSRRTPKVHYYYLMRLVQDLPNIIWEGIGDQNPYMSYLAHANDILVTCDSVNMIVEACATGKPVHIFPIKGSSEKLNHFYEELTEKDIARFIKPHEFETWKPKKVNAMTELTKQVKDYMSSRKGLAL